MTCSGPNTAAADRVGVARCPGTSVRQSNHAATSHTAARVAASTMRIAVISDIHANLQALTAVLSAIDEAGAEEVWCLGDLVGYGAKPDEAVELVRGRASVCLAGNHDLGVLGTLPLDLFGGDAYVA